MRELLDAGVQAIAVCLLWAVANPEHERRVAEVVARLAPEVHVTCSHEVSSRTGEYERFAATAINAFIGPESAALHAPAGQPASTSAAAAARS